MKLKSFFWLATYLAGPLATSVQAALPIIVAQDSANFADYAPQPNPNWSLINGGSGYNLWTPLNDTAGGGTYMEGVGVNNRQVDGNYSFALYAGTGSYDISRPLGNGIASGEFDILTRFDLAGSGPNLVSLRAGNSTSSFGSGELLSFGIVNGNQLSCKDAAGFRILVPVPIEARGSVWSWNINFNATRGSYFAVVTNVNGLVSIAFAGHLEATNTSVGSFAVINSSTGSNQNLVFDLATFSVVPEPGTLALVALGFTSFLLLGRSWKVGGECPARQRRKGVRPEWPLDKA